MSVGLRSDTSVRPQIVKKVVGISRSQVAGPTIPSTGKLLNSWNAFTAASVLEPKCPSGFAGRNEGSCRASEGGAPRHGHDEHGPSASAPDPQTYLRSAQDETIPQE